MRHGAVQIYGVEEKELFVFMYHLGLIYDSKRPEITNVSGIFGLISFKSN